jgi:hypothetical protein
MSKKSLIWKLCLAVLGSGISLLDADYSNNNNRDKKILLSKKVRLESILLEKKGGDSSVASEFMHVSLSLLRLSL